MKKLALDLDGLKVESFATAQGATENGTVEAFSEGWSDGSICPTTEMTRCKRCQIDA